MKYFYYWLGGEIVFIHVGHGLLGAGVVVLLAIYLPWYFFAALIPVVAFSVWGWFQEASLVMPVARRYLSGDPFPATGMMTTATTKPDGHDRPAG